MKKLYCIRHCSARGQEPEAQLTAEGEKQALSLSLYMKELEIDRMISSPYERAKQTVRYLAESKHLIIEIDERLAERRLAGADIPDWREHLKHSFDDVHAVLPGGESSYAASIRVLSLVDELTKREENHIVLVTHGNLLALLLKAFDPSAGFHTWQKLTNPDVYEIDLSKKRVRRLWV
jgi:2,3-bisphosphoglycerate-dependent phosphoglycerate mutase